MTGPTGMVLRMWLLARHPERTDSEVEEIAERMMGVVGAWPSTTPLLPRLEAVYEEVTG